MAFAFEVVETVRREEPELFDDELRARRRAMLDEAVECEIAVRGGRARRRRRRACRSRDMRQYLEYCADQRLGDARAWPKRYGARNPFAFMDLQDVQEVANFFERRVSAYQVGVAGEVAFDAAF